MYLNNSFNILPWYDSLAKRSSQKWYAFGQSWPLLCPKGRILPFQFVCEKIEILSTVFAVDVKTGAATDLKVTPTVVPSTQADATYYVVKMPSTQVIELPVGLYYLRFNTSLGYLYSEEISIIDDAEECVKIEYWNEDTLKFTSGEINFEDNFKFELYLRTTIGKPEYEFEEELTKRLGYKFIESQTSNKLYKFAFVAPEYICDAMRLIRLCDYIKITTKFDSYNALSFAYEPKWQEQGDLAAVDAEFDTDCIIQKLESFNRRLRESFYNALLAEIDEPVLFSTDTVAQYYTEFTSMSYINGKLIRQLESMPISELRDSLADIVLPADNQSDNRQAAKKVFLSDILSLVETISNYFKPHYSGDGQLEWIEALAHIGIRGGLTMYIDGGNLNLPSIYEGLPIDWKTLIRDANGVLMVNPDIELGGGITTWDELQGKPSWIGSSKPVYNYSEIQGAPDLSNYALSSDVEAVSSKLNDFLEGSDTDNIINKWKELESFLKGLSQSDNLATILGNKAEKTDLAKYIPIAGATEITGEKNFVGGIKVNGSPIYYDNDKKYWKLEGDLLVTGGVTMYGNDSEFVASTIMDAILYDDSTLGINVNGELYVKGGTGGATTMGSLSNVGSWADSVASQDRIMYQAANSSQWVAKNLSDLAVGGVTGDYLPLSGGVLTSSANKVLELNTTGQVEVGMRFSMSSVAKGWVGYMPSDGTNLYNNASKATFGIKDDGTIHFNNNTVWNAGNDGSGSGLDADLLDGKHYSDIINGNVASATRLQAYQHNSGEYTLISGTRTDNTFPRKIYDDGWGLRVYHQYSDGRVMNNYIATISDNVASATKLQTARTIWGQSFDGTGNVDGTFTVTSNDNLPIRIHSYYSSSWVSAILATNTSLAAGQHFNINVGYGDSAYNNAWVGYYHAGVGSKSNRLSMGLHSVDDVINILGTGNVGIGTTNPGDKLSIAGGCGVNDYLNIVATNNVTAQFTMYASSGGWRFQNNPNANGNLELIFRSPSAVFTSVANFTSSGNILVTGGVTMYSARKLKSIQDERGLSLEELSVVKPTRFTWKDGRDNKIHIGGIADDVIKVLPEVIYKTGEDDTLTMDYGNAAFAIAASLIKPVVNHEERIKMLEEENKRLKEEVEQLKWNIA